MPFIPRQVKPPARLPLTCKVPEATATLLKLYAEFLDSTQEYVVVQTLSLAFRKDKEFHAWLATTHPDARLPEGESPLRPADPRDRPPRSPRSAPQHLWSLTCEGSGHDHEHRADLAV